MPLEACAATHALCGRRGTARAARCWALLGTAAALCCLAPVSRGRPDYAVALTVWVAAAASLYWRLYHALRNSGDGAPLWAWFGTRYRARWREAYRWDLTCAPQASVAVSVVNSFFMVGFAAAAGLYAAVLDPAPCPLQLGNEAGGDCAWESGWLILGTASGAVAAGYCLYDALAMLVDDELAAAGGVPTYLLHHLVYGTSTLWYAPLLTTELALALVSEACNAPTYFCLHIRRAKLVAAHKCAYLHAAAYLAFAWPFTRIVIFGFLSVYTLRAGSWVGTGCAVALIVLNIVWFWRFLRSTLRSLL